MNKRSHFLCRFYKQNFLQMPSHEVLQDMCKHLYSYMSMMLKGNLFPFSLSFCLVTDALPSFFIDKQEEIVINLERNEFQDVL